MRWTDLAANDQLLYFTSPSHSHDGRWIILLSDRGGEYNLWALDMRDNTMRRISHNCEGWLRSYVYFDGHHDARGLSRAGISFDAQRNRLYYIQGNRIICAEIETGEQHDVATLPSGEVTAFTDVSRCGKYLCVPTIHHAAFDEAEEPMQIGRTADALGIRSTVRIFETATGHEKILFSEPGWVSHVQFRPTDAQQILYNHEWCDFGATRRMWWWNGYTSRRLRPADALVDARGTATHEVWRQDGQCLIYHGHYFITDEPTPVQRTRQLYHQQPYIGRCFPDGDFREEIALDTGCHLYGHFMPNSTGECVVSDGYFEADEVCREKSHAGGLKARWITLFHLDWETLTARAQPLCRHDSSWSSQDAHPHPIFSHDAQSVWFTSDREGKRAIYQVDART